MHKYDPGIPPILGVTLILAIIAGVFAFEIHNWGECLSLHSFLYCAAVLGR